MFGGFFSFLERELAETHEREMELERAREEKGKQEQEAIRQKQAALEARKQEDLMTGANVCSVVFHEVSPRVYLFIYLFISLIFSTCEEHLLCFLSAEQWSYVCRIYIFAISVFVDYCSQR